MSSMIIDTEYEQMKLGSGFSWPEKLRKKDKEQLYYRVFEPYCVYYNENTSKFFFVNRDYKNLGNFNAKTFVPYPDIGKNGKSFYFYNDGCKPWDSVKNKRLYNAKLQQWKDEHQHFKEVQFPIKIINH